LGIFTLLSKMSHLAKLLNVLKNKKDVA